MPGQVAKFASIPAGDRLHQGEILAGIIQVRQNLETIGNETSLKLDEIVHPYAIVLTQDCDLVQDFNDRQLGEMKHRLANILLCATKPTTELKSIGPQGRELWTRVIRNQDIRYHCTEAVPVEQDSMSQGVPSLGCDFKLFFTIPADEVYKRLELNQISRRSRLVTPYAEHMLHRFCNFMARIPLPENHHVNL